MHKKVGNNTINQLTIHSASAMKTAWKLFGNLGFKQSEDLDFMPSNLPIVGFK